MSGDPAVAPLTWSSQLRIASSPRNTNLVGDKILLPPSALEQLLAAAPIITTDSSSTQSFTSHFDPYNPYTFEAERRARAQAQDRQQRLPHPLTFRLVNPHNGRVAYTGIREFSAEDGEVVLSRFLRESLGIEENEHPPEDTTMTNGTTLTDGGEPVITIHARELPKGTYVKLRPLEAGYDPQDWKSLLEKHMQANYTTLTNGEIIKIPSGRKQEDFRFLIDGFQPEGEGICIVDTDLEVDIEPLNEEQARETLQKLAAKNLRAPGTQEGSSAGGELDFFKVQAGQVVPGEYVDYQINSWNRSQGLQVSLNDVDPDTQLDLFVSPYGPRQRARPRNEEWVFSTISSNSTKSVRISPTNDTLQDAEAIWISVYAYLEGFESADNPTKPPIPFALSASSYDPNITNGVAEINIGEATSHSADETQCKNCKQWIPTRTLMLHENFCYRNNILCPHGCGKVFLKRSPEYQSHWHCPHDTFHGLGPLSLAHHNTTFHTPHPCASCDRSFPSLILLAHHKTTVCPGKLILCQFCHLEVPQEGNPDEPDAQAILSGLTPHELADGARTTECHLCNKIVRLRDMPTHLRHHSLQNASKPAPRVCRNAECGRTRDGVTRGGDTRASNSSSSSEQQNMLGLCATCWGPLYVSMHDPDGRALKRRVERRYLTQLLTGCGKAWCGNALCKSGRANRDGTAAAAVSSKEAVGLVRPLLAAVEDRAGEFRFCVEERSQRQRNLAEMMAAEGGSGGLPRYGFEWCVAAAEAEGADLDKARTWLKNWAPITT